jgi:drug/metabolite transporter (DMT)-like permease
MQPPRAGFLLAVAAAFVWSFTGPGISYLLTSYDVPRLTLAFWRDFFAALVVLPLALYQFGLPSKHDMARFAIAGVLFIGLYHALWIFSVSYNGPAVAVVLIYTFPAFATIGSWLLWRERPTQLAVAGLVLAFIGCGFVVQAYRPELLVLNGLGILCGVATGILQAGFSLFSQRTLHRHHPWTTLAWTMTFGTIALLLTQQPTTIFAVGDDAWAWLVLIALAIGPTLGGYVLYILALRKLSAGVAGTVVTLEAPFAALLGTLLLRQWLEWPQLLGLLLVLVGAILPHIHQLLVLKDYPSQQSPV